MNFHRSLGCQSQIKEDLKKVDEIDEILETFLYEFSKVCTPKKIMFGVFRYSPHLQSRDADKWFE